MGKLDPDDFLGEYLSGFLIGAEIGEARRLYPGEEPHVRGGAKALVKRYLAAFEGSGGRRPCGGAARRGARAFLCIAPRWRTPVTLKLAPTPLVAILRGVRPDEAEAIAGAIVEAGFGAIEVPLNSPEPLASIARIALRFGERVLLSAPARCSSRMRSTTSPRLAGRLVVSPNADRAVIERGGEAWAHRVAGRRHDDRGV